MNAVLIIAPVALGVLIALQIWRWTDHRRVAQTRTRLAQWAKGPIATFDPSLVAHLPEPARRYFLYTIAPGAPLWTVTEIRMHGEIGLGTQDKPNYMPMHAEQVLAPPYGLVWDVYAGKGLRSISGSDGFDGETSWVRFWLLKSIPVVRVGGTRDHARAAFGRVVAEAAFWVPAAMLPGPCVSWEAVTTDVARATVACSDRVQTVDITVAEDGRPETVVIPRWTDANPEKTFRLQPFGGFLSEFREFDGYKLPTRVEGGNFIGTDAYFPFYKARVDGIRFLTADDLVAH